jgi:uncharacterized RDD family membrane protein YckC
LSSKPDSGPVARLDSSVFTETPEGILLELRPAGFSARYFAFALDWGIRLMVIYGASLGAALIGGLGVAFWLILTFALEWLYPVAFELTASGATPGKRVFALKVVMDNGLPVTTAAALTRNLLRVADFLPFAYGFAAISVLVRHDGKRLGDLAAGTLVVHVPRVERRTTLEDVPPIAPARTLSPDGQAALVALAARAHRLTSDRLDELAALAASASGDMGRSGHAVTRRVLGVAQWVVGRRP